MEKTLGEITDQEWVRYKWLNVTSTRDTEPRFLQLRENTPEEAATAARQLSGRDTATDTPAGIATSKGWWERWFGSK